MSRARSAFLASLNIARRLARRYAVLLGACALVLGLFEFVITGVIATFDVPGMLTGMIAFLPANVRTAMDIVFGGLSPTGLLGFGWDHPIAHIAGSAAAVVLGARAVAGEIEDGTLELVLAQPISRLTYLLTNIVFAACALAFVCGVGMAGTLLGSRIFELSVVTVPALASAVANFALVLFAMYAATLFASAFTREGGRALGFGVLFTVVNFMVRVIALLWDDIGFLVPYTIHSYYAPRLTLDIGHIPRMSLLVLLPFITLTLLVAIWQFDRRDIP
jgi:ABC-2 type transport system permease protein